MRRSFLAGWMALVTAGTSLGCASARIRKANEVALAAADARVLEGCYECLRDARAVYERLSVDKHAPKIPKGAPGIVARLFETTVLVALREKELALDARASLERARALAPKVPAAMEPQRVLAMADAVLPDATGMPSRTMDSLRDHNAAYVATIDRELVWAESAPLAPAVRKYIALSLDCSYSGRKKARGDTVNTLAKRREVPINAPPLVTYRAADCAMPDTLALKRVLYQMPSFDEAGYALAGTNILFAGETGGEDVRKQLDA